MTVNNKRILLVHGWGSSTKNLENLKIALEETGWICFSPELPGFGAPESVTAWGITDYSEYVLAEGKRVFNNKDFFVFGHSFGGMIAIRIGGNKDNKNILGIILCGANGISRPSSFKRDFFYILAKLGKIFMIFPQFTKLFRRILYFLAREHDYAKTSGIMRDVFKKVISDNLKPEVSKLKLPVLILWGKKDKATPIIAGRYINKVVRQSKLIVYSEGDHFIPYFMPRELAKEINEWYLENSGTKKVDL